jgi:hypothetical protein
MIIGNKETKIHSTKQYFVRVGEWGIKNYFCQSLNCPSMESYKKARFYLPMRY